MKTITNTLRLLAFLVICILFTRDVKAQIFSYEHCSASLTQYTNDAVGDSIYFYETDGIGELEAIPEGGVPGYDFIWQQFDSLNNAWVPFITENDVPTSYITGLTFGAYRVTIIDGMGDNVGCYTAWIAVIDVYSTLDVWIELPPENAGCSSLTLHADITSEGTATSYSNIPEDPLIIDATTEITVCFDANHTFVSDLGFYLVGPAACGSPTIELAPSPGICNGGNNIDGLCFSSESLNDFDVCNEPTPLSGTFGTYDGGIAINWAPVYGCDASAGGWAVQIYDCVGIDVGSLTGASITFTGISTCGELITQEYSTPPGFSSPINDNSCSPGTASIYTVDFAQPDPIPSLATCYHVWTCDPYWDLGPDSLELDCLVDPAPPFDCIFTFEFVCEDQDTLGTNLPGCGGGGLTSASIPYNPVPIIQSEIFDPGPLCEFSFEVLGADPPGGIFSGLDVTADGQFGPTGPGLYTINYDPQQNCTLPSSIDIDVAEYTEYYEFIDLGDICADADPIAVGFCSNPYGFCDMEPGFYQVGYEVFFDPTLVGPGDYIHVDGSSGFCSSGTVETAISVIEVDDVIISEPLTLCGEQDPIQLDTNIPGGLWSGTGITDDQNGIFDPIVAGPGVHEITYETIGFCPGFAVTEITVADLVETSITQAPPSCSSDGILQMESNIPGGIWGGSMFIDPITGEFDILAAGEGNYAVSYDPNDGCSAETSIDIEVVDPLPVQIADPGPVCILSDPIDLEASHEGGIWSGNGITDPDLGIFDPSIAGEGIHNIQYEIVGICVDTDNIDITVEIEPTIEFTDPGILCEMDGLITLNAIPNDGVWSGSGIIDEDLGEFDTETGSGNYTINYALNSTCPVDSDLEIQVNPNPEFSLGEDLSICEGESTTLDAGPDWDLVTWTGGIESQTLDIDTEGIYEATVTLNSCSSTDELELSITLIPEIDLGPDVEICEGESIIIEAPFEGEWSNGESGFSAEVFEDGILEYVYPNSGCPASDQILITVLPFPVIELGLDQLICEGDLLVLDAGQVVSWSTGDMATIIEVSEEGTYSAQVANGACLTIDSMTVSIMPLPLAILGDDIVSCEGEIVFLTAEFEFNETYSWSTDENTASITVSVSGTYEVETSNMCGEVTDEIEVIFEDCSPFVYMPNAFTPNDDGRNDVWIPVTRNVVQYELIVVDRWGNTIFKSEDIGEPWLGNVDNGTHYAQSDIYIWRLIYRDIYNKDHEMQGHVTVIR